MAVEVLVALAHSARSAVVAVALALLIAPADSVEMMVVEEHPVENVLQHKLVQMEFVWEPPVQIVLEDNVETTEPVEIAESAVLDNDAEQVNVSVTMTVMREIVELLLNLMELILPFVHKDHAGPAPVVLLADLPEGAQPSLLVM